MALKQQYGTSTAITITLASLAALGARESAAVDNSTDQFDDAQVYLAIPLQAGTPGDRASIEVYLYGSEDGTNYTDNATGANAALTMRDPTNLKLLDIINTPTSGGITWKWVSGSVAAKFGGIMPREWGIVVVNRTNIAFNATEGNFTKTYSGIYYDDV